MSFSRLRCSSGPDVLPRTAYRNALRPQNPPRLEQDVQEQGCRYPFRCIAYKGTIAPQTECQHRTAGGPRASPNTAIGISRSIAISTANPIRIEWLLVLMLKAIFICLRTPISLKRV